MNVEERLYLKATDFLKTSRGFRRNRLDDIFTRRLYIVSEQDVLVENYLRKRPKMAFNPGALLENKTLTVFPRLIFEYYTYTSSIGLFKLNVEDLINGKAVLPVHTKIILWPKMLWEFKGCEDARVFKRNDSGLIMLYTGYGYLPENNKLNTVIVQAYGRFDEDYNCTMRNFFKIRTPDGGVFLPKVNKDSAFIDVKADEAIMLTRPLVKNLEICWSSRANIQEAVIYEEAMEPILPFEDWEWKVGWSTNTVKISSNEYLVGWHGILREDYSYRNGLALVDGEGRLLAISDYLLAPKGLNEEYGDRPLVIFGNGLVTYKEILIWVGGVSDYAIGCFTAELDKALESLKWIKRI
ncbi:glycosidase [Candidatus Bathyarchaeota archaeon]|nr:glycosidase [Candidatus Bathyarchaeota archaeon]